MSYINEALKKAQKEKDGKSIEYIQSLETSGKILWPFYKKTGYFTLIIFFILLLILSFYLWPDFILIRKDNRNEKVFIAEEKATDQNLGKSRSDGTNPVEKKGAIESDKGQDSLLFNKASSLTRENRIEEAKVAYRKVLSLNPGHLKALNDLGVLLLHEGQYEPALKYFEKAVRLDPDNVDPYYNLACLYALRGEKERGMAYLIKSVDLDSRVKDWIKQDKDLASLKNLPEFDALIE